jgi:FtsP/CotA-like multicopper oxidase with cupredoxin domain
MQSTAARIGVLAAVIAAAVVLFIVLNGDDDDGGGDSTTTTGAVTRPAGPEVITVKDGEPVGGVKTITVNKGDTVNLQVNLDKPENEIHVHGYEIEKPADTSPVRLSFAANIDGIFEIEVHLLPEGENEIAELKVNP